jgi:hypothetical protein
MAWNRHLRDCISGRNGAAGLVARYVDVGGIKKRVMLVEPLVHRAVFGIQQLQLNGFQRLDIFDVLRVR